MIFRVTAPARRATPAVQTASKKVWQSRLMANSSEFTPIGGRLEAYHKYFLLPKGHWDYSETYQDNPRFTADGTTTEDVLSIEGKDKMPNLLDDRFGPCALLIKTGRNGAVKRLTTKGSVLEPTEDEQVYAVMNDSPNLDDKDQDGKGYQGNPGFMDITITEQ